MPQIKEYTAENDVLRPSNVGAESFAQAARRVGAFYSQAGEVLKQSAQDKARAAEALARAAGARAGAAGALATEEKAKAGAESGLVTTAGTAIEQAEAFAGHQEVSHGAANFAEAAAQLTKEWNGTVAAQAKTDPNNSVIGNGFMQGRFEQWAQNYVQGFHTPQGQDWATEQVNHLRNHMVEKTTADMSTMQGIATTTNLDKMGTSIANAARNDPSTVDYWVGDPGKNNGQIDRLVHATVATSGLTGVAAYKAETDAKERIRQYTYRSGAMGVLENAPDKERAAKDFNDRYSASYDDPMLAEQITKAARTERRADEIDQDRADRRQKEQDNQESKSARDEYIKDLYAPAVGGQQTKTLKDVLHDDRLKNSADREHLIGKYIQAEKPEPPAQVSHKTMADLLPQIRAGQYKSITDVPKDVINKLDHIDYMAADKEINFASSPDGQRINEKKKILDGSVKTYLQKYAPDADAYYRWNEELGLHMDRLQKEGKNPNDVFNSKSPEYMGSQHVLDQYLNPLSEQIQNNGGVGAPAAPAPKGGAQAAPAKEAFPPVDKRIYNNVYPTPKGPARWMGDGWELVK